MIGGKLDSAFHLVPRPLLQTASQQTEKRPLLFQRDLLEQVTCRLGDTSCASAHASTLNRATAVRPLRAKHSLFQLQRQYGNRYVQRVLAQARESDGETGVSSDVEQAIQRTRSGGQPLDSGVRAQMEPAFGADFGGVRVHADGDADTLGRSLNARAFTTGQDIFFRQGAYNPGGSSGRELLAHELTHVVQQRGGKLHRKLVIGQPGGKHEQEADRVAERVIQKREPIINPNANRNQSAPKLLQTDRSSSIIQRVGECGSRCRVGRPSETPGCPPRQCLGCIPPPGVRRGVPNKRFRSITVYFCPDSDTPVPGQSINNAQLNRRICYYATRHDRGYEVRVYGYASQEGNLPYRNQWMATHRAWAVAERLRTQHCPNIRRGLTEAEQQSIKPYIDSRTEGVSKGYPLNRHRFVRIEFIHPPRPTPTPRPERCDDWAVRMVGEPRSRTILGLAAGRVYIEMLKVQMAHRWTGHPTPGCGNFRYVAFGAGITSLDDLFDFLQDLVRGPLDRLVEGLHEVTSEVYRGLVGAQEWDCKTFCTTSPVEWPDWEDGGNRTTGPYLTFRGTQGKTGRATTFDLSGNELPGFQASTGLYTWGASRSAVRRVARVSRWIANRLRGAYRLLPARVRETIGIFEDLANWLGSPLQTHDWTRVPNTDGVPCVFPSEEDATCRRPGIQ